jgi:hypothetical protein
MVKMIGTYHFKVTYFAVGPPLLEVQINPLWIKAPLNKISNFGSILKNINLHSPIASTHQRVSREIIAVCLWTRRNLQNFLTLGLETAEAGNKRPHRYTIMKGKAVSSSLYMQFEKSSFFFFLKTCIKRGLRYPDFQTPDVTQHFRILHWASLISLPPQKFIQALWWEV